MSSTKQTSDCFAARLPDDRILLGANGREWKSGDLLAASSVAPLQTVAAHTSVALMLSDPLKLVLALLALDGVVERIALLPHDLPSATATELLGALDGSVLLTDLSADVGIGSPVVFWGEPVNGDGGPPLIGPLRRSEWVFATSGTTGTPKLVTHHLNSLTRTVKSAASQLRWGQTYDLSRFAGIQVLLQALLGGGYLNLWLPGIGLAERLKGLVRVNCNALSATPTLWRKILMTPGHEHLPLEQITLGGETADAGILRELARRYPVANITHVYASTEAGAAFSVKDGKPGFPVSYLSQGPGGIEIKITEGRLFVRSRSGLTHYVNRTTAFSDSEGFVDTGDLVEIHGDRCLFVGRANGIINIGGNKLYPQYIEQLLLSLPEVGAARVFAKPNAITGQIVVAEIVPSRPESIDVKELKRQLQQMCLASLGRWQVPGIINIVSELTMNGAQKLLRSA